MAFSLVANAQAVQTTSSIDTTGANLIVIWYVSNAGQTITDNKGNTWSTLTLRSNGVDTIGRLLYCLSPTVGTGHTFSNGSSFSWISVAAFSGAAAASVFDQENGAGPGTNSTSLATGSITPGENNELVIAAVGNGGANTSSYVADSADSFTLINSANSINGVSYGGGLSYQIQTTATARDHDWSWTTSATRVAAIASFKAEGVTLNGEASTGAQTAPAITTAVPL
jgi:hypothetical protein